MGWPPLLFYSLKFSEIFVTIVLFSGYICILNTQEEFNGEEKIIVDLPFPCRETHVLIVKTLTSMFEQLPICDLGVVLINYHAIEISRLLYNCPL